ncbi:YitT family protein [Ponticaulis profundi]|uniref:YitT family protein n=1 Tax=Ponticaulis profundi TaxID=2665222 RepID=A0ABW1SEM6_9PROT|tara:strand:- start:220 stop:822 length:603 start_codon:yes stop_codon:yes gene_type:complete
MSQSVKHKWYEDVVALLVGALLIGMGVIVFSEAKVLTGGVSGASLVLSYATPFTFGQYFFVLNAPFYILAVMRMGWQFTLKTVVAVTLVSIFPTFAKDWISLEFVHPAFSAIFGGALLGMGMIALFRHRAGIGGVSILSQFLQDKKIMNAGIFQLVTDLFILLAGAFVVPLENLFYSVLGAIVLNLIIAINHRPGRYFGS